MKIVTSNSDQKLVLNADLDFQTNAGWQENLDQLEEEILEEVINPIANYETVRYIHEPYVSTNGVYQSDIWYCFYFSNAGSYSGGCDYNLMGITPQNNATMIDSTLDSFFSLEFYKTPNDVAPDRTNRKLVFTRDLSLPAGERFFYTTINEYIFIPVFTGSNFRNKENMYFFWFHDDSAFDDTQYTGDTFWISAKFYNSADGSISDFTTTGLTTSQNVTESTDMYYKMIINRTDYSYIIYRYNGTQGTRIGTSGDPILFFEKQT